MAYIIPIWMQNDVINLLKKLISPGVWEHDAQDNNGDAHLKAGIIGPSEVIPIINGKMGLSTWQNIFFVSLMVQEVREILLLQLFRINFDLVRLNNFQSYLY